MSESHAADETVESPTLRPRHELPESIGPFRILERIGEGGMGVIYKAEQRSPVRRVVALKVIKLGMDTREVLARFEAERQALAMMSHPNIARVLDAGATESGRPYFAMEFVPGVALTKYCDDQRLGTRERLELFYTVCEAVQHAHQKGIIHRDLKPSNILVTVADGRAVPKVIDFGIAKATTQSLTAQTLYTQTGALIGTPEYMSPEQAQTSGLDVDTRTDIYSLGVILYELLTGTLPFDPKALRTAGLDGMARMIRESEPQKPSTRLMTAAASDGKAPTGGTGGTGTRGARDTKALERELRGDLDWVVLKAMEKDRTRRYESAASFGQDIERHLKDEPVMARPPSAGYRVGKFVRRHRGAVAAASALTAALVLGIVGTTVGLLKARAERDRARNAETAAVEQRRAAEAARENERTANVFLRDLMMSFGNAAEGKAGAARAIARLDAGWLKDQPETQMSCRIALGMFLIQENDGPRAEKQFNAVEAMARRPDGTIPRDVSGVLHRGRGMALWMRKDLRGAERELRAAIEDYRQTTGMEAKLAQLLFGLSAIRQSLGDVADAQRILKEAMEISANEPTMRGYISADRDTQSGPAKEPAAALTEGRFDQAMLGYVRACATDPGNHWNWYHLACLKLYLGDEATYREAADEMLDHFGQTDVATIGERTAKVWVLIPRTSAEMAKVRRLLDQAMASDDDAALIGWFALTKGLAEYRLGHFDAALKLADKAASLKTPAATASVDLVRAMAHHGLGEKERAREFLERAGARMNELAKPGAEPIPSPENWLVCHILKREAEQVIGVKAGTPGPAVIAPAVTAPAEVKP